MESPITPQPSSEPVIQPASQDTSTPTTSSPIQEKSQNKWLIIVLVLLFLIAFGVVAFFVYQNYKSRKQTPQLQSAPAEEQAIESPAPTIPPIAEWETYTNTKHNYLLKYPPGFTVVESLDAELPPETFQTWDTISFGGEELSFSIHVNPDDRNKDPIVCSTDEECKSKVLTVLQKSSSEVTRFSSTVFGKNRIGFKHETDNSPYTYSHYLTFLENDKLWLIILYNQDTPLNSDLTNKILSTFKFIK